ncbi:MAG: hypothetical protein IPH65_02940 [Dehalococcoidia bacterium]|uniref:hypothetical protein n=1 Tax=Candidatus Amarobacter glycogenicus TaxID=3140699 RepID=UPI0031366F2D|nr:hypothetical protein [Dehalococcoidia bacterium]
MQRAVETADAAKGVLEAEIYLLGDVVLEAGIKVTKTVINRVEREGKKKLDAFDKETVRMKDAESLVADSALDDAKAGLHDELHPSSRRRSSFETRSRSSTASA